LLSRPHAPRGLPIWRRGGNRSGLGSANTRRAGRASISTRGSGAAPSAVFDVESNEALHLILNEWADIIPAHFDTYPLVDLDATKRMLAEQAAAH
jgi:hypothetical protein